MSKALTIKRFGAILLFVGAFALPTFASADSILYQQSQVQINGTGYFKGSVGATATQQLGTGLQGTVKSIVGAWQNASVSAGTVWAQILCSEDAGYTTPCSGSVAGLHESMNSSQIYATSTLATPFTFDPDKYYRIQYSQTLGGGSFGYVWGFDTDVWSGGVANIGTYDSDVGPVRDLYFQLWGVAGYQPPENSVDGLTTPTQGSVTGSTNVSISFDYFNAGTNNRSGVRLDDQTIYLSVSMAEQPINSSGAGTYSATASLTAGHYYMATPYIKNSVTGEILYGSQSFFSVVSNAFPQSVATSSAQFPDLASASSSAGCTGNGAIADGLCSGFAFLFIPSPTVFDQFKTLPTILMSRAPFTFITAVNVIVGIFNDDVHNDMGTTTAVWVYNAGPAHATTTLIDPVANVEKWPLITTMRDYAGYMLYVVFALWAFMKIARLFSSN